MDPNGPGAGGGLEPWIDAQAWRFADFTGSMTVKLNKGRIRDFLWQLRTPAEVSLIQQAIEFLADNYWTSERLRKCLRRDLRPEIERRAERPNIVYIPFGGPEDSSALLFASAFKGQGLATTYLTDFLLSSLNHNSSLNPGNTAICFIDDNYATATQAPAIFKQYLGIRTLEEETHVPALPTTPDLQTHLKQFRIVFSTIYGSTSGRKKIADTTNALGLQVFVTKPPMLWRSADWKQAVSDHERPKLRTVFERYGAPLLRDKVGPKWDEPRRRKIAMGYGEHGRLFLFHYQTPTSIPAMFWRYGMLDDGRFWQPLFWRESDYERFIRRLNLGDEHEQNPRSLWNFYKEFYLARDAVERTYLEFTLDEMNTFLKDLAPRLGRYPPYMRVAAKGVREFFEVELFERARKLEKARRG